MTGLEFAVLCVAALLIVGCIIDTYKLLARHSEVKRSRFLEETRAHRMNQTTWPDDGKLSR